MESLKAPLFVFALIIVKKESENEVAQSCLTLCDPMDCSLPGSSVHGIFQAMVLEWIALKHIEFHSVNGVELFYFVDKSCIENEKTRLSHMGLTKTVC